MSTRNKTAPVADAPVVDAPVVDAPVVDAPVVDALGAMVDQLTSEVEAELTPEEKEKAEAIKAACERQLKLAQLSTPEMESAMTVAVIADKTARRSWEFVADRMLIAGFVSSDLDTPTKERPASAEYLAIKAAVIRYGYPQKEEGTDRMIVQEAINAPARQRVLYSAEVRAIVKEALYEEIPRFLRAIKSAMKASEDRGPRAAALSTGEQLIAACEDWMSTLRKADEKKLDFNVIDVIGALKDVIIAVRGD
jgi:ribonuclease E